LLGAALEKLGGGLSYGDTLPTTELATLAAPLHAPSSPSVALPAVGERRRTSEAGERFGILLHALLEQRTGGAATAELGKNWLQEHGFDEGDYRRVLPVAERLLGTAALQRFFDPALYRRAWNEVELTAGDGVLQRLDRLVEFDDAFWVLDYKSSHGDSLRLEDYRSQVATYCQAVACVFPGRSVRGALIFADASVVDVC